MKTERIAIAISGGVDSAVAAHLLKERGADVVCVFMDLGGFGDSAGAAAVAKSLSLPFEVCDCKDKFKEIVIGDFVRSYRAGETPNPCVVCNRYIKFGLLREFALSLGCTKLATGHYAGIERKDGVTYITKSDIAAKDQSYMLWQLGGEVRENVLFPVGNMLKSEVRHIAASLNLPCAESKESMDICFIPDGDYRGFLKRFDNLVPQSGSFVDGDGKILGVHRGYECYTIGQRRGLGISAPEPLFVLDKQAQTNTVILGLDAELYKTEITLRECEWAVTPNPDIEYGVKIRFRAIEAPAVIKTEGANAVVTFASPVRAPAPGQSAVVYAGKYLLGGGIIEGSRR